MSRGRHLLEFGGRVVVVSPHLDDAVLSLGAVMSSWARAGAAVEVLTVFACDPDSTSPSRGWDRRGGFATEGESARARREEDRRACAILGVAPEWLPFGSVDYERHGDEGDVIDAVVSRVVGAHTVVLPGLPLSHPDHAWLTRALVGKIVDLPLGLYAEQPYTRRAAGGNPEAPAWLVDALSTELSFERLTTGSRDRMAKWRAIRAYRSQLPLLAMSGSLRRGPHVFAWAAERVAWTEATRA